MITMKPTHVAGSVALIALLALSVVVRVRDAQAAAVRADALQEAMDTAFAGAGPVQSPALATNVTWYHVSALTRPTEDMRDLPAYVSGRGADPSPGVSAPFSLAVPVAPDPIDDTGRGRGLLDSGKTTSPYMDGWLGRQISGGRDRGRVRTGRRLGIDPFRTESGGPALDRDDALLPSLFDDDR
jgi:hypothetical protein